MVAKILKAFAKIYIKFLLLFPLFPALVFLGMFAGIITLIIGAIRYSRKNQIRKDYKKLFTAGSIVFIVCFINYMYIRSLVSN